MNAYESPLQDPFLALAEQAKSLFIARGEASVALLQRHFKLAYDQALALMERLHDAKVVGAPSQSGQRLLALENYVPVRYDGATVRERHVRTVRDLALFLVECREQGEAGDSRAMAMLLHPTRIPVSLLRAACSQALAREPATPVTSVALAVAELAQLQAAFPTNDIEHDVRAACHFVERPLARELITEHRELVERSFVRLVRYLEKRLVDGYGAHTRCFEVFVPDAYVPQGRGLEGAVHREHVIPCAVLRKRCNELLHAGVPIKEIALWLQGYLVIVRISAKQRDFLDGELGLKTTMPATWDFETGCVFARLHAAEVGFEVPPGYEVCRHDAGER